MSHEDALKRLLELSETQPNEDLQNEQKELIHHLELHFKQCGISQTKQSHGSEVGTEQSHTEGTSAQNESREVHASDDKEKHQQKHVEEDKHSESDHHDNASAHSKEEEKIHTSDTTEIERQEKPVTQPAKAETDRTASSHKVETERPPVKNSEKATPNKISSAAKANFEQDYKEKVVDRRSEVRKSVRASPPASPTGSECDLSDPQIADAYNNIRDDNNDHDWMLLGYGSSKKALQLYGTGTGGLQEFVSKLAHTEVTYGYVRVKYGDSGRAKFVFVTYVPDSLSGLSKAKANMHKPSVDQFLKYYHVQVNATSPNDLQESTVQAKLAAAGGANYGTGGAAPVGSENFGNIKSNARSFFSETEKKGSVNIRYNKDPLSSTTPVSLTGRAGITEKYIK